MTYRSRYSVILLLVFAAKLGILLYAALLEPKAWIFLIFTTLVILFVLGIQYTIADERLVFKFWGFKTGSVDIHSISKVERSYLLLSSNAGSFKRLYITLKAGSRYPFLLISPVRESEFIESLRRINPEIEVRVEDKSGVYRFWDLDV